MVKGYQVFVSKDDCYCFVALLIALNDLIKYHFNAQKSVLFDSISLW